MKKHIVNPAMIQLLLLIVICIASAGSTANAYSGFLAEPFEAARFTFEDENETSGLVTNSLELIANAYAREGNALVVAGGAENAVCYAPSEKGFYGKTSISFRFAAERLNGTVACSLFGMNCDLSGQRAEIFRLEIKPKPSDDQLLLIDAVYGNGMRAALGETERKLWNDVELQLDTVERTVNVQVNARSDILVYWQNKSLLTNHALKSYFLKEFSLTVANASDQIYLDDLSVCRSGVYQSASPVLLRTKDVYTSGVKITNDSPADKRYASFIAQYQQIDGLRVLRKLSTEIVTVAHGSSYILETFLQDDLCDADEITAFTWEFSKIAPTGASRSKRITQTGELYDPIKLSSGFEGSPITSGKLLNGRYAPQGWGFHNWATPAALCDASIEHGEVYEGGQSVYIKAVDTKFAGWVSEMLPLPEQGIKTVYMVKQSADYAGNQPSVFITFYDADKKFIGSVFQKDEVSTAGEWTKNVYYLTAKDYTPGAGYYQVNLTTERTGTQATQGKLYYDLMETGGIDVGEITANVNMKPDKAGSWYVLGEQVTFTASAAFSPFVTQIKGVITDIDARRVDEVAVSRESYDAHGWRWTPPQSGFYEIRFYAIVNGAYSLPVYTVVNRSDLSDAIIPMKSYVRNIAVVPNETKPIGERNPIMAFSYQLDGGDYLALADTVGFSAARIHAIPWGAQFTDESMAIHTAPGQFDWSKFDPHMAMVKKYGFDIIGNLLYTPKWASPSDSDKINICVREYSAYAPTDMAYLEEFIEALIERYGADINTWEVWNEPNTSSVFWKDTPGNYFDLLKTAYVKIKELQPDSQVWIGGLGARRYLSFYSELLRLGAYPYFDKLAMHGYDVDPWNYNNIAASMGLPPKEYVNTEGHFTLVTTQMDHDVFISEKRTAFRLMLELLRQFKYDAKLITKFSIYDYNTIDTLAWCEENKVRRASDGLFHKTVNIEPRLSAVAMHTFLENIGKSTQFGSELRFAGTQEGVTLECDDRSMLLVWSRAEEREAPCAQIKALIGSTGVITDWEGKAHSLADLMMKPYEVYYIKNFDESKLSGLPDASDEVIYSEYEKMKQTANVPSGTGNQSVIFDHQTMTAKDTIEWVEDGWVWKGNAKAPNFKAKFAVGFCGEGLDIAVDVTDDNFKYDRHHASVYQDMVQIGIDTLGNGIHADNMVVSLWWDAARNTMSAVKTITPNLGGNIPANWTAKGEEIQNKLIKVTQTGNVIRYRLHIDYSELYPYYTQQANPLRMNVTAYDYDNASLYRGYYEWGSGLAFDANKPVHFGKIHFHQKEMLVEQQNNLVKVSGVVKPNSTLSLNVFEQDGALKYVEQDKSDAGGSYSFEFPLKESGSYTVNLGGFGLAQIYSRDFVFHKE